MNNKKLGCAFGLLVGDALGTTFEFKSREYCEKYPITTIIGKGPFLLKPGDFTDDGIMFLCSLESLLEKSGFDENDHMEKFLKWFNHGYWSPTGFCFDIGTQTVSALTTYAARGIFPFESTSAGNGSLMRISSIPLFYSNLDDIIRITKIASEITHNNKSCTSACIIFNILLYGFIYDVNINIDDYIEYVTCNKIKNILVNKTYLTLPKDKISSSGYVVDTFEAVLWSFYSTDNYSDCLIKAVHLGGDADTVGAIVGALAGAKYGFSDIPVEWSSIIWNKDKIVDMVRRCN